MIRDHRKDPNRERRKRERSGDFLQRPTSERNVWNSEVLRVGRRQGGIFGPAGASAAPTQGLTLAIIQIRIHPKRHLRFQDGYFPITNGGTSRYFQAKIFDDWLHRVTKQTQ